MNRRNVSPVQFRSPEIEAELARRNDHTGTLGHIARRDLERYYAALADALHTVELSEAEAMLICDALNGILFADAHSVQLLWANIDDSIRLDGLDAKWDVDGPALVNRLRSMSYVQVAAVVDAVERAWLLLPGVEDREETLREVGLIKPVKEASGNSTARM